MSISESLSGVSSELDKILKQLQDIKGIQDEIGGATANMGPFGGRVSGGKTSRPVSQSGGNFSTPPKPPGSQLGGITPGASGGGGAGLPPAGGAGGMAAPAPPPTGGSRLRNAAVLGAAAAATAGYNLTPGIQDVVPFQSIKFGASVLSAGGYSADYYSKVRSAFGGHQSDPFGAIGAANIATMGGQGLGTGNFSTVMRETATTSMIFGMGNMQTASALTNMTSGTMAGRLAQYGIYVSDFESGDSRGFGNLIDQIWRVHYGSSTRKVDYESVAGSIRGGWLGVFINKVFADDPYLREMVIKALLMKAQAQGKRLDYKSMGRYGADGAAPMSGAKGTTSAMDFSVSMGNTPENNPMIPQMRAEGSRADLMEATQENTIEGWRASTYTAVNINELSQAIAENGGPIIDFLLNLKGAVQGFQSNGETNTILQILGGLFGGGGLRSMFAGGGDVHSQVGTSTSDSIPAMLSRGEYVINARAAQMIGKSRLDAMNSMGHSLGNGFASPARHFAKGGYAEFGYTKPTLGGCADGACAGDATLDGWTALNYGDPALRKFSVAGAPNIQAGGLWLLERDGIGQYMADFAAAYQAHPALGGGRLDLNIGYSYGHALRDTASGKVSNHSAGVAMDLRHDEDGFPLREYEYTASKEEKQAIESLLQRFSKIEWGGGWDPGSIDEMHFEIESPGAWGKGGHDPGEGAASNGDSGTDVTETPSGVMRSNGSAGVLALVDMFGSRPKTSGFSSFSGGAKSLGIGGGAFSWIDVTAAGFSAPASLGGSGVSESTGKSDPVTGPGSSGTTPSPGNGKGPKWLFDLLVSKGLRGGALKTAWVIGVRESGGNPNLIANVTRSPSNFEWPNVPDNFNFDPKNKYGYDGSEMDVGIFQINSEAHFDKVGGDMLKMVDPTANFEMMRQLSSNFTKWTDWGIAGVTPTGFNYINWASWGGNWANDLGPKTEARDAGYLKEYEQYNTEGYSEGAYSTHEGIAKLHEGEMVLPANMAEQFRKAMRESSITQAKPASNVNITLHIDKASDEEAERFARKVKTHLQDNDWFDMMRSR